MRLSYHCEKQIKEKGFDRGAVLAAAVSPTVTYESHRHPGQWKHVRGGVVAVVDPKTETVITCFVNIERTPLRPDQR